MIGKTLSHYKILEELGRGGMGIVYKAEDTKLDRTVAIKILPSAALTSEDDRERFYREAKAAAQLHHPHIASVFEIDETVPEGANTDDLRPFIAMEFIDGETLDDRIKSGPLKLGDAVRIGGEIADALKTAHSKNIVHRDIKSANVMLDTDGRAKVLDFGLAKTAQSTKLTRMGSTLDTMAYMSPEQARGEEVDGRTDIWALGVVLYEMVSGRHPFPGDYEQAVVYSILNEDPEPLTAVRTGVPMELERITAKCLAKQAKSRYQSTTDLIVDLDNVDISNMLSDTASSSRSSANHSHTTSTIRSRILVAGGIVLALIAGWLIGNQTENEIDKAFQSAPIRFSLPVPDGYQTSEDGNPSLAISPDGMTIAYRENLLLTKRRLSEAEAKAIPETEYAESPVFSPDGTRIGFLQDSRFKSVSENGTIVTIVDEEIQYAQGIDWSRENEIYFGLSNLGIWKFEAATSRFSQITQLSDSLGHRMHNWPCLVPK